MLDLSAGSIQPSCWLKLKQAMSCTCRKMLSVSRSSRRVPAAACRESSSYREPACIMQALSPKAKNSTPG